MKRREFLSTSLQGSLAASISMLFPAGLLASELPADITELTASKLSAAIRDRQVSCLEVMQAYLQRIERYNPVYNAIVNLAEQDSLLGQARRADTALDKGEYWGWMHGMPHAVKDLANVEGMITTSGSRIFANRVATADSSLVADVRKQGAIFIGKTNTPEFGLGSQTYNEVFGATGSAWNPALTAGGSSGGAACGLGTHMLPVADGSDMMGSLRNPGDVRMYTEHRYQTTCAQISPSGEWVASGDVSGAVRVWGLNGDMSLKAEHQPLSGAVDDIQWSLDGQRIVCCGDGKVRAFPNHHVPPP